MHPRQKIRFLVLAAALVLAVWWGNRESPRRVLVKVAGASLAGIAAIEKSSFDRGLRDSSFVWLLKHEPKGVSSVLKQMGFGLADGADLKFASQEVEVLAGVKPEELANLSLYRTRLNDRDLYWLVDRDMKRSFLLVLTY